MISILQFSYITVYKLNMAPKLHKHLSTIEKNQHKLTEVSKMRRQYGRHFQKCVSDLRA